MRRLNLQERQLLEQQQTNGTAFIEQRRWMIEGTSPRGGVFRLGPFLYGDAVEVYVNLPLPCEIKEVD